MTSLITEHAAEVRVQHFGDNPSAMLSWLFAAKKYRSGVAIIAKQSNGRESNARPTRLQAGSL
jgi:hypothetical protein